jgi:sterol desaturase/sphingolipid hydroxylase (fatty acid hydroxylase superfamily)
MNPDLIDYGFLAALAVLQAVFPRESYGLLKKEWKQDLLWLIVAGALVPRALSKWAHFEPTSWCQTHVPAIAHLGALPLLLQFAIALIAWDFTNYWVHRWMHRVPILWELHKAHHSTIELTAVSGDRGGFLQNLIGGLLSAAPLALLGIDFRVIAAVGLGFSLQGHLVHSNLRFGKVLSGIGAFVSPVLSTPAYHRWHHVKEWHLPGGQNFGVMFTFWDRLFRTQYRSGEPPKELGFSGMETYPKGFVARFLYPVPLTRR